MKNLKTLLIALLIGILIGVLLFFGLTNFHMNTETRITQTTVKRELEQAASLVTTRYNYSNVGRFDQSHEINGWSIPLTQKNFILTYRGEALLGVDLDKAEVKVDEGKQEIKITLEPVQILSNTIQEDSIEVYDESTNIFNPISINDYKSFAVEQKEKVEKEILEEPIYETAQDYTVSSIEKILHLNPNMKDWTILVVFG